MYNITQNKGFQIEFDNGLTLSTQFGAGNYCSNNRIEFDAKEVPPSPTAEIAVIKRNGDWFTKEMVKAVFPDNPEYYGDDVVGYVPVDDWAKIVAWCASQPS